MYLNQNLSKNFMIKKMSKLQFQIADRLGAVCIKGQFLLRFWNVLVLVLLLTFASIFID